MKWLLNAQSYLVLFCLPAMRDGRICHPTEGVIATLFGDRPDSIRQRRNTSPHWEKTAFAGGLIFAPEEIAHRPFLSRVHSCPFVVSGRTREGRKADQDPEHRTENSEPQ